MQAFWRSQAVWLSRVRRKSPLKIKGMVSDGNPLARALEWPLLIQLGSTDVGSHWGRKRFEKMRLYMCFTGGEGSDGSRNS